MKKTCIILAVFLVLSLALGTIGCGDGGNGTETKVVKVGAVLAQSGYLGTIGKEEAAGLKFVVDEVNAAGGIESLGGATLQLVLADDKSDPSLTSTEAERLMTQEGVAIVFMGPDEVAQALVAPLADRYKVPVMALGSYDKKVTDERHPYFWGGIGTSSYPGTGEVYKAFLDMVIKDYGQAPKTVGLLSYQATDIQKNRSEILLPAFAEYGLAKVYDEVHPDEVASWDAYALKIKQANADVFLAMTDPYSCSELLKALDRSNYLPRIGLWLALNWDSGLAMLGQDVAQRTLLQPGQFTSATMVNNHKYGPTKEFKKRWEAANPTGSFGRPIIGAQAMYALLRAIRDADSADPVDINEALGSLSIPDGDPDLITPMMAPLLAFTEGTHEPVNNDMVIAQWQDSDCVVVRPFPFNTADARFRA